jgi:hypothetical protein
MYAAYQLAAGGQRQAQRILMQRGYRLFYLAICGLLAIACCWWVVAGLWDGAGTSVSYIVVLVLAGILFASTALAMWRNWPRDYWLAGVSGGLLALCAVSVVLLGWEDVGGASVAIPLSVSTGLAGCLGLAVCFTRSRKRGAA